MFDRELNRRRLTVTANDRTADELSAIAATGNTTVAAVVRECIRRALPSIRRDLDREKAQTGEVGESR